MDYHLHLNSNGAYISDLNTIRNSIKVNGNKASCHSIIISHPKGISIKLHMNFSLEQNSKNPPTKASLHVLGFTNNSGKNFRFAIDPFPCDDFMDSMALNTDGSYKNLGHPMNLPSISNENLWESIQILNSFNANELGQTQCDALSRLIIATSESIRFSSVAEGIAKILENEDVFTPNSFEIIGWGGHSIAS